MASSATLALNSAVNCLRVLMGDRPLRHQIHLSRLSQKPGPPLNDHFKKPPQKAAGIFALQRGRVRKFALSKMCPSPVR
jgi:hypothetical protein